MRALMVVALVLGAVSLAEPARADGGYASRVIAVDASADTLIAVGLVSESDYPAIAGLIAYGVGGPVIHASHGNWSRAGLSLGTRLGLPLLGVGLGNAVCVGGHEGFLPCFGSTVVGAMVGMLAAQIVDPALIVPGEDPTPAMLAVGGHF